LLFNEAAKIGKIYFLMEENIQTKTKEPIFMKRSVPYCKKQIYFKSKTLLLAGFLQDYSTV
jgi:hypothetical protein